MDDQNLPQPDTSDPYDQFYADNPGPAQPAEPRQAPDHIAMNSQTLQNQSLAKGPTPAFRPGETAPAQPVHNNIPQQEESIYSDGVADPQALINQAITDQSEEIGEVLPTFETTDTKPTPVTSAPQSTSQPPAPTPQPQSTEMSATQQTSPPQPLQQPRPQVQPSNQPAPTTINSVTQNAPAPDITPEPAPIFKQPETPQASQAKRIDTSGLPPTRKQMTVRKIAVGVFLFVLMTIIGATAMVFASNTLGNSTNPLQNIWQNLPFIPKSTYAIISGILTNDTEINSYDYSYTLNINFESQSFGDPQVGSMLFSAKGAAFFDEQGNITASSSKLDFSSNTSFWSGSMSVNTVSNNNAMYTQLGGTSGAFSPYSQYLPPVDQWYLVDFSSPENIVIDDSMTKDIQLFNYPQSQLRAIIDAIQNIDEIESAIEQKNNVTLANESEVYRIIFTPTTDMLLEIVNALALANNETLSESKKTTFKNVLDNFEVLAIEIWAEKETYLVNKLHIDFTYVLNSEEFTPLIGNSSLPVVAGASRVFAEEDYQDVITGSITADFSNYNNATPIQIPTNAESLNDYLDTIDPGLFGITLNPQEELLRVNNAQVKSDINQIGIALEAHATQNGGEYPETLDSLVSTLYLQELPILPESRSIYCDTSLNYIRTDDAKYAAVWIDLEPCPANPAENASTFFVYKTGCKVTFEQTGLVPTKNSLTESCE